MATSDWARVIELGVLFFSLFVPAMIGVGGSFALYIIRKFRRANRLRLSLRSELTSLIEMEKMGELNLPAPLSYFHIPTMIYESSASDLGLLTDEEVEAITAFYSQAEIVNILLREEGLQPEFELENLSWDEFWKELEESDSGEVSLEFVREHVIYGPIAEKFNSLGEKREEALNSINRELEMNEDLRVWAIIGRATRTLILD